MSYQWKDNVCCRSIYKVLESDALLDEFESSDTPFEKAGELKVGNLRYFSHTGTSDIRDFSAWNITRHFLNKLSIETRLDKQSPEVKTKHLYSAVYSVFRNENKTLKDLAEAIDALVKFDDEVSKTHQ